MRVVDTAPVEPPLVSFEIEVEAGSEAEARALVRSYGQRQLHRPFTDALGAASDDHPTLLARVARLGSRRIVCVIDRVGGGPSRFTVALTAFPGPGR